MSQGALLDALSLAASDATGTDLDLDDVCLESLDAAGAVTPIEDDDDCRRLSERTTGIRVRSLTSLAPGNSCRELELLPAPTSSESKEQTTILVI